MTDSPDRNPDPQAPLPALFDSDLTAPRLEKLRAAREAGLDPYPYRFDKDADAAALQARFEGR